MENKKYHLAYKKLNPKTILAVRHAIKKGLFKTDINNKSKIIYLLNIELSNIYNVRTPTLSINNTHDGRYKPLENTIELNYKLSLITYLHEFKHALQHLQNKTNNEDIARSWSLSLFYKATPKLFENAVSKGLIFHQNRI